MKKQIDIGRACDKVESKFWFSCEYDYKDAKQTATVILEINYRTSQYSISPYCGTIDSGFNFILCSHKFKMWKAILQCINDAIDFAEIEINT
jgi:hypothetical protein